MEANKWLSDIKNAKKSCIVEGKTKKVHYLFEDEREMVEEYNLDTNIVTKRAWKTKTKFAGEGDWTIELGDPEPKLDSADAVIKEGSDQPYVTRRITKLNLEWRIHNLPYPVETYSVSGNEAENCLIVRTSNKKYYKKLVIPELERAGLAPSDKNIQFTHKYNTLIITYTKPKAVIDLEMAVLQEVKDLKPSMDGKLDCKPS